jgi:hypothetical protein
VLTYDDVVLPPGRLADRLRAEQYTRFRNETWLDEHLRATQSLNQELSPELAIPRT